MRPDHILAIVATLGGIVTGRHPPMGAVSSPYEVSIRTEVARRFGLI